jgi:hypothetical protein
LLVKTGFEDFFLKKLAVYGDVHRIVDHMPVEIVQKLDPKVKDAEMDFRMRLHATLCKFYCYISVAFLFLGAVGLAIAPSGVEDKDKGKMRDWLFKGTEDRINSLETGYVVLRGSLAVDRLAADKAQSTMNITYVFSGQKYLYRCSQSANAPKSTEGLPDDALRFRARAKEGQWQIPKHEPIYQKSDLKEVREFSNGSIRGYWSTGLSDALLLPSTIRSGDVAAPWDIRAMGMMIGRENVQDSRGGSFIQFWKESDDYTISIEGDHVYRYEVMSSDPYLEYKWTLVVDASQGFTPTTTMSHVRRHGDPMWKLEQKTKTSWDWIGDTWVQKSTESAIMSGVDGTEAKVVKFDFEWKQVNERLPDSKFTLEELGLPETIGLVDATGDKPNRIRESQPVARAAVPTSELSSPSSVEQYGPARAMPIFLWTLLACVCFIALRYFVRWLRGA